MHKLGLVIVDDERSARDLLKSLLEDIEWVEILAEAAGAEEALSVILEREPQVILLDIQMPVMDGFSLIEMLMKHQVQTEVIFITAYERYAMKAIKASAFDYLLKPVKKKDLVFSLNKLYEKVKSEHLELRFGYLIDLLSNRKRLKFRNRTGFSVVDVEDILYCQAVSNYTDIQLDSGKILTVSTNLGKVEDMLPPQFFCKISRSLIINIHYLKQVDRKSMTCNIAGKEMHKLSISKKYLKQLENSCNSLFN